jgi:hypothetical protein
MDLRTEMIKTEGCKLILMRSSLFTTVENKNKTNSVALVRKRTTLNERPPLVGEVGANFCE